jgi:hypothetical protein
MWLAEVRQAVMAALSGLPLTAGRVFDQEPYDLEPARLPCLVVYTGAPDIEAVTLEYPMRLQCDVEVRVEVVAQQNEGGADLHDVIAGHVIAAMALGIEVQGVPRPISPRAVEQPEISGAGERVAHRRSITFVVGPLFVDANDPNTLV